MHLLIIQRQLMISMKKEIATYYFIMKIPTEKEL